ncbi:MAG: hypothetical protein LC737_04285, partial [Chloroflexi bacterium]|nr:hypothetical protein [Chloroflexota bacterium]
MQKIFLIGGTDTQRAMLKASLDEIGYRATSAITHKYTNTWLAHRIKPFDLIIYNSEAAAQPPAF